MVCDRIEWVTKSRQVYDKTISKVRKMIFLRLNVNNEYNYGMGHVDIADQLRLTYKVNVWLRNYKWWHAIFWWGMQVLIVNSHIVYKRVLTQAGFNPVSHYKYQESLALGLINPENHVSNSGYNTPPAD